MATRNQRNDPRVGMRAPIRFGIARADQPAHLKNASRHGAAVVCRQLLNPGTRITLRLDADDGPLTVAAEVRWSRWLALSSPRLNECDMGVLFLDPDPALNRFVDRAFALFADRRAEPRFEKVLAVRIAGNGAAHTHDIGRGGLYAMTPEPPAVGSHVEIELTVAKHEAALRIEGRVVRATSKSAAAASGLEPGFAMQFTRFADNGQAGFEKHIDRLTDACRRS